MAGQTYYIDPQAGDDGNSGLATSEPLKTYTARTFAPGDAILFKRGSVIRDVLATCDGSDDAVITYGAYGEGNMPEFLGSAAASDTADWVEDRPNVWRYTGVFASEVCNLVFNYGESCGNLRWEVDDLKCQGEWFFTGIGTNSGQGNPDVKGHDDDVLYLFSQGNPGQYYASIECSLWGERSLVCGKRNIVIENLAFRNSGVHGYHQVQPVNVTIRNCEFTCIGGAVWSRERRIRFGNAVELWDGANDVVVEGCLFDKIYDAGVTHQGGPDSLVPTRVYFRNNLFIDNGLAAYECRGPAAKDVYFENNTCINAGGDFTMQGEEGIRQSEIYPQPICHHVFIWRMEGGVRKGDVYIRNNIFYEAAEGAAVYSVFEGPNGSTREDELNLIIDNNCYWQTKGDMLMWLGGKAYTPSELEQYRADTGHDKQSVLADPLFVDAAAGDYRLQANSPCPNAGIRYDC